MNRRTLLSLVIVLLLSGCGITMPQPDDTPPSVRVDQAPAQADPIASSPITFAVEFSEDVEDFAGDDVDLASSTAGGPLTASVSGSGSTYTIAVTGMSSAGTVVASIPAGAATSVGSGVANEASTSTDNSVTYTPPTVSVTVDQAASQADPTATSPIVFTEVFGEPVTGFSVVDLVIQGTADGSRTPTVTGSGTTYTIEVTGMTTAGTVEVRILAGAAMSLSGVPTAASTSTDNSVTWLGN